MVKNRQFWPILVCPEDRMIVKSSPLDWISQGFIRNPVAKQGFCSIRKIPRNFSRFSERTILLPQGRMVLSENHIKTFGFDMRAKIQGFSLTIKIPRNFYLFSWDHPPSPREDGSRREPISKPSVLIWERNSKEFRYKKNSKEFFSSSLETILPPLGRIVLGENWSQTKGLRS